VAAAGHVPQTATGVRVRMLDPSQTVVLSGLHVAGSLASAPEQRFGLYAESNSGHLRAQNCKFVGVDAVACGTPETMNGYSGARWSYCADVATYRVEFDGGDAGRNGSTGHPGSWGMGVDASDSNIALFRGRAQGGEGLSCCDGSTGGAGVWLSTSSAYVSEVNVVGGNGGHGNCGCSDGGHGGHGVIGLNASEFHLRATVPIPGTGGWAMDGLFCNPDHGGTGSPVHTDSTSQSSSSSSPRRWLDGPNVVREGKTLALLVTGAPGESIEIHASSGAGYMPTSNAEGPALLVGAPAQRQLLRGLVPATGEQTLNYIVPELGPGVGGRVVHLQAVLRSAQGQTTRSNALCVALLDAAY
jgi:hypothetical protein